MLLHAFSLFQIRPRRCFVPERRHLVGIDAHHDVIDVIVDLGEPVPGAGRDDDYVSGLELIADAVSDVAGRRFMSAISGPSTSVPDPSIM